MATEYKDLGDVPGKGYLALVLMKETFLVSKSGQNLEKRTSLSIAVKNRNPRSQDVKKVCSVVDGRIEIEPVPGTESLSDAEKLAFKSMTADQGVRPDFQELLRDPIWQHAINLLLVEHVMES